MRPDLRQSEPVVKFLGLDTLESIPRSLEMTSITNTSDYRAFSVVDCSHNGDPCTPLYAAAMADTTALSKLGRAWSVIEPEAVGALCIYSIVPNAESGIALGSTFSRQSQKRVCVTRFIRTQDLNLLIAGDSSGLLSVYECKHTCVNTTELTPLSVREIHIKAPFIKLVQSVVNKFYFASIGGDQGLKYFKVDPNDCQVIICASGRIQKSLAHPKESLTSLCLLESNLQCNQFGGVVVNTSGTFKSSEIPTPPMCRAVVGTSCGQLLLYNIGVQPPEWLGNLNLTGLLHRLESPFADEDAALSYEDIKGSIGASLVAQEPKVELGSAVTHIVICRDGAEDCLVAAVNGYILIFSLRPFLAQDPAAEFTLFEQQFKKRGNSWNLLRRKTRQNAGSSDALLGVLSCPCEPSGRARISAMCWCEEYNLLFCAYQRGVTCWSLRGDLLQCLDMVRWGTVRKLEVQAVPYQGLSLPMLFAATSLGGLRMLDLVEAPHWKVWSYADSEQEEEPTTTEVDHWRGGEMSNSVILDEVNGMVGQNQKDILRAELYDAFRPARF